MSVIDKICEEMRRKAIYDAHKWWAKFEQKRPRLVWTRPMPITPKARTKTVLVARGVTVNGIYHDKWYMKKEAM